MGARNVNITAGGTLHWDHEDGDRRDSHLYLSKLAVGRVMYDSAGLQKDPTRKYLGWIETGGVGTGLGRTAAWQEAREQVLVAVLKHIEWAIVDGKIV